MKNSNIQSSRSSQSNYRTGILFAIAGTSLFSLKPIFIKLAFQEGIDASTLLALRMIITFPFFLAILIYALKTRPTKAAHLNFKNSLIVMVLGFLGYYLASALDFKGLSYISAQMERLILFTYPLMVAVLASIFFHEKITLRIVLALVLSYLGVGLIYFNEPQVSGTHTALGATLVALAGLSFALYLLFSKRLIGLLGSLIFTSLAMISSTLFVLIQFFSIHEIGDLNVSTKIWFISALLSIFSTLIPSFFTSEAIHRIGATRASIMGSIGPVVTIIFAVYLLNEPFGILQMTGLALVLLGVNFIRSK